MKGNMIKNAKNVVDIEHFQSVRLGKKKLGFKSKNGVINERKEAIHSCHKSDHTFLSPLVSQEREG